MRVLHFGAWSAARAWTSSLHARPWNQLTFDHRVRQFECEGVTEPVRLDQETQCSNAVPVDPRQDWAGKQKEKIMRRGFDANAADEAWADNQEGSLYRKTLNEQEKRQALGRHMAQREDDHLLAEQEQEQMKKQHRSGWRRSFGGTCSELKRTQGL